MEQQTKQTKWPKSKWTLARERREAKGLTYAWEKDPPWRWYILLWLTCGAKTRNGTPCKIKTNTIKRKNGNYRCRYHGGLSTGPKTPEGRARSALNLPRPGPGRGHKGKSFVEPQWTIRRDIAKARGELANQTP